MMDKKGKKSRIILYITAVIVVAVSFLFSVLSESHEKQNDNMNDIMAQDEYEKDPIVLKYYTWDDERFYIEPIVESFNASNPSIEVQVNFITSSEYDDEIVNLLESERIDIVGIRGLSKMVQYQNDELLLDITSLIQNSDIDITNYGNMYNNISVEGRYYGMPTRSTCWVLVYNKDIFDNYNEPYPGQLTWEEYRRLSLNIREKAAQDGIWGGYFALWNYNFAGVVHSNYLYDDDLAHVRESLEWLNIFMNVDKSHMDVEQVIANDSEWLVFFEEGKIAMMPQGEWFVGMVMDDIKEGKTAVNWDLAPMPIFEGQREGTTWGQYQFTGITRECAYPKAAFEFLTYISGEEGAEIFAQYGMLSAYSSDSIRKIYEESVGDKNIDVFFDALRIQEQPMYEQYEELHLLLSEVGESYLLGELTIEEAMDEFVSQREDL